MIRNTEDLVGFLAKKHKLPHYVVRDMIESPFKFLKTIMNNSSQDGIMLPFLGKFVIPGSTLVRLSKLQEKHDKISKESLPDQGDSLGYMEQNDKQE